MIYPVTANASPDFFESRVSKGDVVKYEFDFGAWLEDKGEIVSTVWNVVSGGISFNSDEQSALLTFTSTGRNVVKCVVTTDTGEKKSVWLVIRATEVYGYQDDYGMNHE